MKQERVSVKVIPDNRRHKTNEYYPLKLRITYRGMRKYYGADYDVCMNEWNSINSADAKLRLRIIEVAITNTETDAQKCCVGIFPFTFKKFGYEFFDKKMIFLNLTSAFDSFINQLKTNGQFGTAKSYRDSSNALIRFKGNLNIDDITTEFLESFERWMMGQNKSITTVGIYLRHLRTIMIMAKENGTIKLQAYPF